jgi:hypothetical protein
MLARPADGKHIAARIRPSVGDHLDQLAAIDTDQMNRTRTLELVMAAFVADRPGECTEMEVRLRVARDPGRAVPAEDLAAAADQGLTGRSAAGGRVGRRLSPNGKPPVARNSAR